MLLRHGHMRPRPLHASPDTNTSSNPELSQSLEVSNGALVNNDIDALALLRTRQRAPSRRISKNCASIKRFGNALYIRRRQRHAERIVIQDVERLRQTLDAMDRRLALLDSITMSMRHNAEAAAMEMVQTYFHHMKHGLNPHEVVYDREVTTPFLESMMSPTLKCQDFVGLEHFFKQWEYVTKYHAEIEMENAMLIPLPMENNDFEQDIVMIKATGLTHCRISRDTLIHFFPHIIQDEALVQQVIGKRYSYGYTMILHINRAGQVFQFESRIDLTSGLFSMLSDPGLTLQMVESSMWTKGGNLRREIQEEQIPIDNPVL